MPLKLLNSLVDVAVLTGVDDHSDLTFARTPTDGRSARDASGSRCGDVSQLFDREMEPKLLAVLSEEHAQYPMREKRGIRTVFPYPPDPDISPPSRDATCASTSDLTGPPQGAPQLSRLRLSGRRNSEFPSHHSSTSSIHGARNSVGSDILVARRRPRILRLPSVRAQGQKREFVLDADSLHGLCALAYPDGIHLIREDSTRVDSVRSFVRTDILGTRSYVTALTFHKKFFYRMVDANADNKSFGMESGAAGEDSSGAMNAEQELTLRQAPFELQLTPPLSRVCYVPQVLLVVSRYSYSNALREALRLFLSMNSEKLAGSDWPDTVQRFIHQLCNTPTPPARSLVLQFNLTFSTQPILLLPPSHPDRRPCDISMSLVLRILPAPSFTRLLGALLTEQRVVIASHDLALVAMVMDASLHLLHPFEWTAHYAVLTARMIDYVDVPGYFLMGCHIRYKEQILSAGDDIVFIDLDRRGEVTIPSSVPECDVLLPKWAEDGFVNRLAAVSSLMDYEVATVSAVWRSGETAELPRQRFEHIANTAVLRAGMSLMVDLFWRVLPHLHTRDQLFFNHSDFLASCAADDLPFYKVAVKTSMFSAFLGSRATKREDVWSQNANQRIMSEPGEDSVRLQSAVTAPQRGYTDSLLDHNALLPVLDLPLFWNQPAESFFVDCIECVDRYQRALKPHDSAKVRLSCKYLTGMLFLATGKLTEGLNRLGELYADDKQMFPEKLVATIFSETTFESDILANVKYSSVYYEMLERAKRALQPGFGRVGFDKLPTEDIKTLEEFSKYIERLNIVSDREMIRRLYRAMSLEETLIISAGTFQEFYNCWRENQQQCALCAEQSDWGGKRDTALIKVTSIIRTSWGAGHLLLTQKSLSFRREGEKLVETIVRLEAIEKLEVGDVRSLFSVTQALMVYGPTGSSAGKPVIMLHLNESCQFWVYLIREQMQGRKMSLERKDDFVDRQSLQNCLLMDALVRCSDSTPYTGPNLNKALTMLLYFSQIKAMAHDEFTKRALVYRANPCQYDADKYTVESLLYIPGSKDGTGAAAHGDSDPMLWCAMGSGKVRIFNARSWSLLYNYFEASQRVVCLTLAGGKVWAGSLDNHIYLVDYSEKNFLEYSTLDAHGDFVCSISAIIPTDSSAHSRESPVASSSVVYSLSIDGVIKKWDVTTAAVTSSLRPTASLEVPQNGSSSSARQIQAVATSKFSGVWCMTRTQVLLLSDKGECITAYSHAHSETQSPTEFTAFLGVGKSVWIGATSRMKGGRAEAATSMLLCWRPYAIHDFFDDNVCENNAGVDEVSLDSIEITEVGNHSGEGEANSRAEQAETANKCSKSNVVTYPVQSRGISSLLMTNGRFLWVGTKDSKNARNSLESRIHILDARTAMWRDSYEAHEDSVRSMCVATDRYVVSGAGSNEAKIAVWRTPLSVDAELSS